MMLCKRFTSFKGLAFVCSFILVITGAAIQSDIKEVSAQSSNTFGIQIVDDLSIWENLNSNKTDNSFREFVNKRETQDLQVNGIEDISSSFKENDKIVRTKIRKGKKKVQNRDKGQKNVKYIPFDDHDLISEDFKDHQDKTKAEFDFRDGDIFLAPGCDISGTSFVKLNFILLVIPFLFVL